MGAQSCIQPFLAFWSRSAPVRLEGDALFLEHREERAEDLVVRQLVGVGPAVGQLDVEMDGGGDQRQPPGDERPADLGRPEIYALPGGFEPVRQRGERAAL